MIRERRNNPGMDEVESEVEASKVTWSELSAGSLVGDALAAENSEVFESLQERWGSMFFQEWKEGQWEVVKKIAEGGQAELFELKRMDSRGHTFEGWWVLKMLKEGLRLQDLQRLLPRGMLQDAGTRNWGYFLGGSFCNTIRGATLFNGRFALLMDKKWGDLRKLIDARMMHDNTLHAQPFKYREALECMLQIAKGMRELHERNITHRDLKAANVLVSQPGSPLENPHILDPLSGEFKCQVADYECSVGVLGTGFWRAPEVYSIMSQCIAVKNHNVTPEVFSKASDVYSYGMTCFEIFTGRIPFEIEGFKANDYDRVIAGYSPNLPWPMEFWIGPLVKRYWHLNSYERPTFIEIVEEIQKIIPCVSIGRKSSNHEES